MTSVERTHHALGSREGYTTLEQRFRFAGDGATAAAVSGILLAAPLTGTNSVFGDRPGEEGDRSESTRALRGFSPVPGFRFDVDLTQRNEGAFLVRFSQPDRTTPYLQGELVWTITDQDGDAVLDEQINTEAAMRVAGDPLSGPRPSLRRWLFFRAGHKQVMSKATTNIAALLAA